MDKSKKKLTYQDLFYIIVILSQILPQFTILFSDLCLVFATLVLCRFNKKLIIFFTPFFIISIIIIVFKDQYFYKLILSTFRIFFVLNFVFYLKDLSAESSKKILLFTFIFIFIFTIGSNILGLLDSAFYIKFLNYWNGEFRYVSRINMVVAAAEVPGRFSSFFPQPASSGFWHACLLVLLFLIFLDRKKIFLIFLICIVYFSGNLSKSSIFQYFPIIMILYFLLYKLYRYPKFNIIIFSMLPFLFTTLTFVLFNDENNYMYKLINQITGRRFEITGNHYQSFKDLGFTDYFFGYSFERVFSYKKALGDNSYLTKLFIGGIIYYISYISFVVLSYFYIMDTFCKDKLDKFTLSLYFLLMSLVEIGLTGYSQPQISVLSLSLICLYFNYKNKVHLIK